MIELNLKPTKRQLRQFGVAGAIILSTLGMWAYFNHSILIFDLSEKAAFNTMVTLISCSVAMLLGTLLPRVLLPLFITISIVGWPIGVIVSMVILTAIFYLLLTPLAVIFRLAGRDSLNRKLEPDAKTYWHEINKRPGAGKYFQQF